MSDKTRMGIEHKWVYNTEPDRCRTGSGNLTFQGFTALSWRTAVAHKYPEGGKRRKDGTRTAGPVAVFVNDGIWNSGYTTRHKSKLRHALPPDWLVINVDIDPAIGRHDRYGTPAVEITTMKGLREIHDWQRKTQLPALAEKMGKARNYRSRAHIYEFELLPALDRHNDLSMFLGRHVTLLVELGVDTQAETANLERVRTVYELMRPARIAAAAKARATKRANEDALRRATQEERAEMWRNGAVIRNFWSGEVMLRLHKRGAVETSRGVILPFREAYKVYRFARRMRGLTQEPRPDKDTDSFKLLAGAVTAGPFRVQDANYDGDVQVGCHLIRFAEMDRLFNSLPEKTKEALIKGE